MKKQRRIASITLAIMFLVTIGTVLAIWASTILVDPGNRDVEIEIGQPGDVSTDFSILDDYTGTKPIVPIHVPEFDGTNDGFDPDFHTNFVVIKLTFSWHNAALIVPSDDGFNIDRAVATFDVDVETLFFSAGLQVGVGREELIQVRFIQDNATNTLTTTDIEEALAGTDPSERVASTDDVDNVLSEFDTLDELEFVNMAFGTSVNVFMVVFISEETRHGDMVFLNNTSNIVIRFTSSLRVGSGNWNIIEA